MVAGEARHATWREWADWGHSEQEEVDSLFICSALMPDKADVTTAIHAQPKLTPPHMFFSPRVEKKERARLKTVKFHARTGMIESNRVSVMGKLLPALVPKRLSSELLLGSQGMAYFPHECGKETRTCSVKQAQKAPILLYRIHRSSVETRGLCNLHSLCTHWY